jgi:ABC-type multidrug transport system ATPase subunit
MSSCGESSVTVSERKRRVDELILSFGLQQQAQSIVGTPIRKGISGGQKRRLSIASQLITAPKILFLDVSQSDLFLNPRKAFLNVYRNPRVV